MSCLTAQVRRPPAAIRALTLTVATLAVVGACAEQDPLPTGVPVAARARATPTVVGANVIVLPTLGGTSTYAADINDAGQVVGWSYTSDGKQHAFLWTPSGGMQDLGTLGGATSSAYAINEAGQVVGTSESTDTKNARHAFLWTPGLGMRDLGTLSAQFSIATDINDQGQVVGNNVVLNFKNRAFLWTSELGMRDLDATMGWAPASAINNVGQVVGYFLTTTGTANAFLWSPGHGMQDLGTLDGVSTNALDINDAGQVVGSTWLSQQQPPRAFLWLSGIGLRDLGTLGAAGTEAYGINNAGQIVGYGTTPDAARHAFVWTALEGMEDLYPLTGMTEAVAINNRGQVVGDDRIATLRFETPNAAFVAAQGSGFYTVAGPSKVKAHFKFNATFIPGQSTAPNGMAKFWIPGGQLDFETTAIEMLVAWADRAQFWGTGTLNGAAARFRITAVDGQAGRGKGADAFRIELWAASGTLVYDSQAGAAQDAPPITIDGGNIKIQRAEE